MGDRWIWPTRSLPFDFAVYFFMACCVLIPSFSMIFLCFGKGRGSSERESRYSIIPSARRYYSTSMSEQ